MEFHSSLVEALIFTSLITSISVIEELLENFTELNKGTFQINFIKVSFRQLACHFSPKIFKYLLHHLIPKNQIPLRSNLDVRDPEEERRLYF